MWVKTEVLDQFLADLNKTGDIQRKVLADILRRNVGCGFGRNHAFDDITTPQDYAKRIPIQRYDDIALAIQTAARTGKSSLMSETPVMFEQTGGTSGSKLIPYTATGLSAIQTGLHAWLADLERARPNAFSGKQYWSISPAMRGKSFTEHGTPIGLESDANYLGAEIGAKLSSALAVPPAVAQCASIDEWQLTSLFYLLSSADLSLISVWSPSFLIALLDAAQAHRDTLISAIRFGVPPISGLNWPELIANPIRASRVEQALATPIPDCHALWPRLDTISCWTDGNAASYIPILKQYFPQAYIQGKGLLSTEALITVPIESLNQTDHWPVLSPRSAYYEFVDEVTGRAHTADALDLNANYRLLLTTYNGLYRYDIGDRVCVKGYYGNAPQLEFIGRAGYVSDLVGEKLDDAFVCTQLSRLDNQLNRAFRLLVPITSAPIPHYALIVDASAIDCGTTAKLAEQVDAALCANPQYRYARQIGQLSSVCIRRVEKAGDRYIDYCLSKGQLLGDIKPVALRIESEWNSQFPAVDQLTP